MLSSPEEDRGLHRVAMISAGPARKVDLPQKARTRTVVALADTLEEGAVSQLLLIAFYGLPGDVAATEQAFDEVLSAALAFGGRFAIWGDLNAVQQEGSFPRAFARGQAQPMDHTFEAEQVCTNPMRTRRIDFGVCHRQIVVESVSHFDLPHLSDHVSVLYQIATGTRCDSYQAPRPVPLQMPDADTVQNRLMQLWDQTTFDESVQAASLDEAWIMLSDVAERTLGGAALDATPGSAVVPVGVRALAVLRSPGPVCMDMNPRPCARCVSLRPASTSCVLNSMPSRSGELCSVLCVNSANTLSTSPF